jgi:hypothetical protein
VSGNLPEACAERDTAWRMGILWISHLVETNGRRRK